jgi:hypothetical protein
MTRTCLFLLLTFLALAPVHAWGQTQVNLGVKPSGSATPLTLSAQNRDCKAPQDFRFTSKTAWIKLPPDPVARQVPQGGAKDVQATIDLTGVAPGRYQGQVEVDCETCGFFIFQNCFIDKHVIQLAVDVAPAQPAPAPKADPAALVNDPAVPEAQRTKLRAALETLAKTNAEKGPCEEALAALRAAAASASAAAQEAAKAASAAAEAAAAAKSALDAARAKRDAAEAAAKAAKEHHENTLKAQGPNARDTLDAKAAADAAQAAFEAAGDAAAKAAQAATDAERKAKAAAASAQAAAAAAKAANDALAAKEKECEKALAAAAAAERAAGDAAKEAESAKGAGGCPVEPPGASTGDAARDKAIKDQEEKVRLCKEEIERTAMIQASALKALGTLGALKGMTSKQEAAIQSWSEWTVNLLLEILGTCANVEGFNTAVGGAQAVAATIPILQGRLTPGHPLHRGHEADTKSWLVRHGYAKDKAEAEAVYKAMEDYNANGRSTDKWTEQTERLKKQCQEEQAKLAAMKAAR